MGVQALIGLQQCDSDYTNVKSRVDDQLGFESREQLGLHKDHDFIRENIAAVARLKDC